MATSILLKILCLLCLGVLSMVLSQGVDNERHYLDIKTPNYFTYNSPLKQPDSLRSQPYFDFLSTLYRRDTEKSGLFQPYRQQNRRQTRSINSQTSIDNVNEAYLNSPQQLPLHKQVKRTVVFRPLFVYRQQQIKKQKRH